MKEARSTEPAQRALQNHEQLQDSTAQKLSAHHDSGVAPFVRVYINQRDFPVRNERIIVRIKGATGAFITTRGAQVKSDLKVCGYQVIQHADGYRVLHQFHSLDIPDFLALEAFAVQLRVQRVGEGGAK